jgi:hypothetical protein
MIYASPMMPLLPLLATALLHVAPGETLFVQASGLNLRAKAKATAPIRAQVPIGSSCSVVSVTADGWAELKCPQGKGFGKLELLGPQAPDHSRLFAQGKEPDRPLPDALNLMQRAVTLKPDDVPTQQAFRELFWKAEFDRLVRARTTAKKLLSEESSFPAECGDPSACVKAALTPDTEVKVAWEELRVQGADVVLGQLFEDGLFQLRSGIVDSDKRIVTVQLQSLMVPSEAVRKALGAAKVQDLCEPQLPEGSGSLCGYEYEQSCAPDDCWTPYQSCKGDAATRCEECKLACKNTCNDCRLRCDSNNRQDCVKDCISGSGECEAKCQAPIESTYASCDAEYKSCTLEAENEWERTCMRPCERVTSCVQRCQNKAPQTGTWACVDQCDDKLPESCRTRCLFGFQ